MKHFIYRVFLSLCLLPLALPVTATAHKYIVTYEDIHDGYIIKQIWLEYYGKPSVTLSSPSYAPADKLPLNVTAEDAGNFTLVPGMERKKPFILVSIPAYSRDVAGKYRRLTAFTLDVTERPSAGQGNTGGQNFSSGALAKVTAATSSLSSGTWYKIAVPARGMFRMDYAFMQSLGVTPSSINTGTIRLVGNGGAMLSEDNAIHRPLTLTDNALWINDGGDGTFDNGDFIAFYAPGPMRWDKDSARQRFIHAAHLYADSSYYFLSFDAGPGLTISQVPSVGNATTIVTSFNDYAAHEIDLYNPGHFGKEWWGEKFGLGSEAQLTRSFDFPLGGSADSLNVRLMAAGRAATSSQMAVALNNAPFANYTFIPVSLEEDKTPLSAGYTDVSVSLNATTANFKLSFSGSSEAIGYLNFIELNWRRPLAFAGNSFTFRDWRSIAPGAVAEYRISGASSNTQVWDITNPLQPERMDGTLSGTTFYFRQKADMLHEFVALDGSSFATPVAKGKVEAQNLHSADAPQLVIVAPSEFLEAANKLGDYHRQHDGLRVLVATTQQVYNEFSSGGQDISGIRDMMRYYYLTAGNDTSRMPRYLLLFGDASYDYKARTLGNSNWVPTFESADGIDVDAAYTVDDFYGFLDDNENISDFGIANTLDIGIGRIPVNTLSDANAAVAKIINYGAPSSLGPWRLSNLYIGDNEDNAGNHEEDAEDVAAAVNARFPFSTDNKVYLDNLPFISTPAGERCPDANKAINDQIFKGVFLINYTGHGSPTTMAHERILTREDFSQWKNNNKLPFMITATCDYGRYDNPAYVSNGEALLVKGDGGTIAMLTTTGPVYAGLNRQINQQFLTEQYTRRNGIWPAFGDAIREGKNITFRTKPGSSALVNFYRFTLLGDPAVQPAFPEHTVHTDSIIDLTTGLVADTLRALGRYTISGYVAGASGTVLRNFNGRGYVTVYDKARVVSVTTKENKLNLNYRVRDNVIFKGITTITAGRFSCSFIAPKDINYDYGKVHISYYAENGQTDAAGMDTTASAGGFFDGAGADNDAPVVKPYIGDTLFRDGGITGANTLLYVVLFDSSGINVSGNGVGHDLTAILDGDEAKPYILNDYYQAEPNTYQRGRIAFPVRDLADGLHTFTVKAWDVYNNSGIGTVRFVVGNGRVMQIHNLMNYPNPFTDRTHFFFEHNHPAEVLRAQIRIYNMAGSLVRVLEQDFTPGGSRSNEIIWDGKDNNGALLGSGVYSYRMMLSTTEGVQGTAYHKLVIVR